MISPWLELDSPDEGVRLDSEIVRLPRVCAVFVHC